MGCCASKPATAEEKQEICKQMSREMMLLCMDAALEKAGDVKVPLPEEFKAMKDASAKLKGLASDAKEGTPDAPAEAAGGGGMMGMLNKGLALAEKAVAAAGDAVGQGVAAALAGAAAVLDSAIESVEKPMSTIAQDILKDKKDAIKEGSSKCIKAAQVDDAEKLCSGSGNELSVYFGEKVGPELCKSVAADIDAYIKEHAVTKTWDKAVQTYNDAVEKAEKAGFAEKLGLKAIQLDVGEHIVSKLFASLFELAGEEEKQVRAAPQGRNVRLPVVFFKVFNHEQLLSKDYAALGA